MPAPPFVIAHRGASGYLPEHTLEGKALAYGLGADFLEQDVVASRDGELVVLHDLYLDDTTDVAQRFPDRHRHDGHFYAIDFDLEELRRLKVFERRRPGAAEAVYEDRFPGGIGLFRINTLEEEIELVDGLNRSTGRRVGLYPEIKNPRWHLEHGIDLSRRLLECLARHGYREPGDAVYVQCFDAAELRRVRVDLRCRLKLVQLVGQGPAYEDLLTPEGLSRVAEYADSLGPAYAQLVSVGDDATLKASGLAGAANAARLTLHPYTFRRDVLPPYAATLEHLLESFLTAVPVEGLFCDHPDLAVRVRDRLAREARAPELTAP